MKILQLKLLAFGPFSGDMIDLGDGKEGLHMVYGPNEAGKSSALRALRQMLYGIPGQSPDDFIHPYAKMRIGGVLRHSDGTVIELIRRKGRANTLRGSDDEKLLDEGLFQKFLGGIDESVFETMFGIGHADLVRGGEEIVKGGGDIGQALFAAGAGISDLRETQMNLQTEAEALFTPSASKRPINEAISSFRQTQKHLRDAQLPGQEWEKHDKALRAALNRRSQADIELQARQTEQHRLERIRDALPLISRRKALMDEHKSYTGVALLSDDFGEQRSELLTDLRVLENDRNQAQTDIDEIIKSIEQLDINQAVIDSADRIQECYRELGSYQKAAKDRIKLQTRRDTLRGEAQEILSGIGRDLILDEAEKLRLKKAETARIQELGTQYERLMTRLENVKENAAGLAPQIKSLEKQLEDSETPVGVDNLKDAIDRAVKYGALEDHYHTACGEINRSLSSLELALKKQTLWKGSLEALAKLALPPLEAIDDFDHRIDEEQKKVSQLDSELAGASETLLNTEGLLRELELEQEVPSEETLKGARGQREEGWRLIRSSLDKTTDPDKETQLFIESLKPAENLFEAYEASVYRADDISDRLRREADRVARKAKLTSDQETQRIRVERLKAQHEAAQAELNEITRNWSKIWEPINVLSHAPKEMRAWVQDQKSIIQQLSEVWEKRNKADDLKSNMDQCREDLSSRLSSISQPSARDKESLSDLIRRCQKVVKVQEENRNKRDKLHADIQQKNDEIAEANSKLKQIEADLSKWQKQWKEAVQPLGLDADAVPSQAYAVMEELKSLFDNLKEAGILHQRMIGIDRDSAAYEQKVTGLVQQAAPDLEKLTVEQAASELNATLNQSMAAQSQLERLEKQSAQGKKRLREAEKHISVIKSKLDIMCEEAGCLNYEDLTEAERRSSKRRQIESDLKDIEEQLHRLSAGADLDDFVTEALAVDPDAIEGQIVRLNDAIKTLNAEKSSLDQAIGEERNELSKMDGSSTAAELAEAAQGILARLESDVERFARLRIASAVLVQAIERYREKHQGPVLKRANELFARLTNGFFEGIRAEFDEQANPVLMGVRPGGKELVGVKGMSDGTTDQLYLSLRLSSLESYLKNNEPIPFIVDDILIKFDNERATATLQVVAELSTKTQVIFFTHHRHLVELAKANIEPGILFEHTLALR